MLRYGLSNTAFICYSGNSITGNLSFWCTGTSVPRRQSPVLQAYTARSQLPWIMCLEPSECWSENWLNMNTVMASRWFHFTSALANYLLRTTHNSVQTSMYFPWEFSNTWNKLHSVPVLIKTSQNTVPKYGLDTLIGLGRRMAKERTIMNGCQRKSVNDAGRDGAGVTM
jgi:hypothetical protein